MNIKTDTTKIESNPSPTHTHKSMTPTPLQLYPNLFRPKSPSMTNNTTTTTNLWISRHAKELPGKYYEPSDDDSFPAIDSLTSQGMFQFTVAAEHPIRGVQILQRLCKLYDEPKLYFVVPPHRFPHFKKQSFKTTTGTHDVIKNLTLKQYVLELPIMK